MRSVKHSLLLPIFILSTLVSLIGCKGEPGQEGPQGPAGPNLTGNIIGYSRLIDVNGNRATNHGGIAVTIEGTSLSTITASDGGWEINNLPTGTYTISFSKAGYGIQKEVGYQFVGGGTVYFGIQSIFQIPSCTISNITADTSNGGINLFGSFTGSLPEEIIYMRFFAAPTPDVSSDPAKYTNSFLLYSLIDTVFAVTIQSSVVKSAGMLSGQTVYMVGYAESYIGGTSYIDFATGRRVFPSLNPAPSNIVSVVIP